MECKYIYAHDVGCKNLGINRYIMECKCQKTWTDCKRRIELIDTLWNVNYTTLLILICFIGINRYIMECK